MQDLFMGILIGIGLGGLYQFLYSPVYFEYHRLRLVPFQGGITKRFLRRVGRLLRFGLGRRMDVVRFIPLFLVSVVAIFNGPMTWVNLGPYVQLPLQGFGLLLGSMSVLMLARILGKKRHRRFIAKLQNLAIDRLMHHAEREEQANLLENALRSRIPEIRMKAVSALAKAGTHKAQSLLQKVKGGKDEALARHAEKELVELECILAGEKLLSAKELPLFIDEAYYWHRQIYARNGHKQNDAQERKEKLDEMTEEIVHSQLPLKSAYPDLFCRKCNARADEYQHGRWTYVLCRHCGDVMHMDTGIREVVGVIGNFPVRNLVDGVLYINLWDKDKRRPRFAEVERLEITGGSQFDYDWAVNAVVGKLQEHASPDGWNIPVILLKNPELNANSRKLLSTISDQITEDSPSDETVS